MATRLVLLPNAAEFPASNQPELRLINRRPALAFDASTDETCYWTFIAPQGITGTLTLVLHCIAASATSGAVYFQAAVEAVTPADAVDLDAGTSFDTANSGYATVAGTAGYDFTVSITLTNYDSMAAADYVRLALNRDADNASDNAAGDIYLLAVEFRDGA